MSSNEAAIKVTYNWMYSSYKKSPAEELHDSFVNAETRTMPGRHTKAVVSHARWCRACVLQVLDMRWQNMALN